VFNVFYPFLRKKRIVVASVCHFFSTFAHVFLSYRRASIKNNMKESKQRAERYVGLGLMTLGVVLLVVLHVLQLTFVNRLLVVPSLFILAGFLLHLHAQKRQSRY